LLIFGLVLLPEDENSTGFGFWAFAFRLGAGGFLADVLDFLAAFILVCVSVRRLVNLQTSSLLRVVNYFARLD
jgi:hypothetical protein